VSVGCSLADGRPLIGCGTVEQSGGSHVSGEAALAAALGEAVERYSASYRPEDQLVEATARELGGAAVDPASFALFHERQYGQRAFPFARFTCDLRLRWIQGWSLTDGRAAWLPAQLVHLGRATPGEPSIGYATSNGVACGPTLDEAILAAICEVVERDAFVIAWSNRLSLPLLSWDSSEELLELDRRFFAPSGLRYATVDIGLLLGIPAALGIVRGPPGRPASLGVGAGCAPTIEEAWRKALTEAFSVYRWMGERAPHATAPASADDVRTFDDHLLFYADPSHARYTAFLASSPERRSICDVQPLEGSDTRSLIVSAVALAARHGSSLYAVDVTAPDVREAGLRVARVVAPELCALDVIHTARFLGGERLYRAAYEAGLAEQPLPFERLNPHPHPFP